MRYRLMATYRGVPYEAGVGPTDKDVILFAACPPPEELGFQPATGHWRKAVSRAEVDAVWESRPSGMFRGEPCLVLDELGEHLHISYLGHDPARAGRLGYSEMEPGVFELLAAREDVTDITEDRVDHAFLPWRESWQGGETGDSADGYVPVTAPTPAISYPGPGPGADAAAPGAEPGAGPGRGHRRAAGRPPRAQTRQVFAELAARAALPPDSYAVDEAVDGAICLVSTDTGFEVFTAADGVKREARLFNDEEAAYFYLFGLLAAEAVRDGRLVPPGTSSAR